jgi:hypothetical protein
MAGPQFDPNGAVRFDLRSGTASDKQGARLVLLPSSAIDALGRTYPEAVAQLGAEVGRACGARVAARLGGDAGVGAVHLERWGRAMVLVVQNAVSGDVFVGAAIAGALGAAVGRDLGAAAISRDNAGVRFFVGSRATAERARTLATQGRSYGDVLAALQGGTS